MAQNLSLGSAPGKSVLFFKLVMILIMLAILVFCTVFWLFLTANTSLFISFLVFVDLTALGLTVICIAVKMAPHLNPHCPVGVARIVKKLDEFVLL